MATEKSCTHIIELVTKHALGPQAAETKALVAGSGSGGLGDKVAGLLGALALAVASRRRLELSPEATSLLAPSFELPFDASYTGRSDWPDIAAAAYTRMQDDWRACSSTVNRTSNALPCRRWATLPRPLQTSSYGALRPFDQRA